MYPEPLAGILADDSLEHGVEAAGVLGWVARYLKWRMKFKNVLAFLLRPYREARDNCRASFGCDLCKGRVGACRGAEKVDKDTFLQ